MLLILGTDKIEKNPLGTLLTPRVLPLALQPGRSILPVLRFRVLFLLVVLIPGCYLEVER